MLDIKFDGFGTKAINPKTFENPLLFVNWNLGNQCTYKCSYCAKECHDGSFPWPTVEESLKVVDTLDSLYKKSYKKKTIYFELLGGEVTLWKGFDTLTNHINKTKNKTMLVTNGVKTLDWWEKNYFLFEHVTLSFHPEFADPVHFGRVANLLHKHNISVSILLLMYPNEWEKCIFAYSYFKKNCPSIFFSVQKLNFLPTSKLATQLSDSERQGEALPYTDAQLQWMRENSTHRGRISLHTIFNRKKYLALTNAFFLKKSNSWSKTISSSYLTTSNLNNWKGWNCYVGIDTLSLEQNGDVKKSVMCKVSPPLGSWRKVEHLKKVENLDTIVWPKTPVVCHYNSCTCTHDFKARKEK